MTECIKQKLKHDIEVVHYPTIDSTNSEARRLIEQGKTGNLLIISDEQTAGRGRQGKSFYSPADTGIYMTLVTHPMASAQNVVSSTTKSAAAVCKAIERVTDTKPQIKWINDIYLNEKKICGILVEAISDYDTQLVTSLITGIGINLSTSDFPEGVENAGCLGVEPNRAELIAQITNELLHDSEGYIDYYKAHSMVLGRYIIFIRNGQTTPAKAIDIDSGGGLIVELESGERTTLKSGEISLRICEK